MNDKQVHTRRAAMGLAAGAAVAGPGMIKSLLAPNHTPPPAPHQQWDRTSGQGETGPRNTPYIEPSPLPPEYWTFESQLRIARDQRLNEISRQIQYIGRSRSTSQAYKDYMIAKLYNERDDMRTTFDRILDGIRDSFFNSINPLRKLGL